MILVSYDIPSNKRRRKVAKALLRFGRRVQYSVFLIDRPTTVLPAILSALRPLLDPTQDDVRIHPICATCESKQELLGQALTAAGPGSFRVI